MESPALEPGFFVLVLVNPENKKKHRASRCFDIFTVINRKS
jgi:hypothetical protein